jgi:tRNA pseudouridine55 synthase
MRHGFLLLDKPVGPTSHDAVYAARRILHERDIGHIGTLDPAASGLLVLAVGSKALKTIEFFGDLPKEYIAEIQLGSVSTTYDREGVIEKVQTKPGWVQPDQLQIRRIIDERLIGTISQVPPTHSAVHVNGKRAYELARRGEKVEITPRNVRIDECVIVKYEYPHLTLRVSCGTGTYIRSLAHDLGEMVRCGAYLTGLRRTKVGAWSVENAVDPDAMDWTDVQPLKDALKGMGGIDITDEEWEHVRHGRVIKRTLDREVFAWHNDLPVAVLKPVENGVRARKVL